MALPEINSERWLNPKNFSREIWRYLHTADNGRKYYISNMGRVKLVFTRGSERIMKAQIGHDYCQVKIDGCCFKIHRLVAIAFVKRAFAWRNQVDHRNNNKLDNRAKNIHWVTMKMNQNNPITVWQRKQRFGMCGNQQKPEPRRTQSYISEEESRRAVERMVSMVIKKRKDNHLKNSD